MADNVDTHRSKRIRSSRSQSPHRHHHRSRRDRSPNHHRRQKSPKAATPITLPYNSRQLSKRDYEVFKPMFASYLDIQKGKYLEDMDETEAKGRWKSFVGKWNRGELSEGWYDPSTLQRTVAAFQEESASRDNIPREVSRQAESPKSARRDQVSEGEQESESDDDDMGPTLPGQDKASRRNRPGPSIPNMQDLELKREMAQEDRLALREDIQHERKLDRKAQKERLDDLVPRAEAGTRERQLEKKAEVNAKMKSFRERSPGVAEIPDTELMGAEDGVSDLKRTKQEFERKKNEREIRREEVLRAKAEEREERLAIYRQKEEGTMDMLKQLAKQRFG